MLIVLSRIVPYKPNIEKLALQADTFRDSLLKFLFYLEKAGVVKWLLKDTLGINYLNKPDKLYLNNTNLMHALSSEKPDATDDIEFPDGRKIPLWLFGFLY